MQYTQTSTIQPGTDPTPPNRLIAVGGAKGGIGKSMLVANLGVVLARSGRKTVLVDLDLGGANLHLYLGCRRLPLTLSDFLDKSVAGLADTAIQTEYGPGLIACSNSRFGTANIHHARKIKLIKALRSIAADYVIVDLGADTSLNTIDFFLAADTGIVLTTCDPAAYLEAYHFLRVSILRKLNRLFAPESVFRRPRDRDLEVIIKQHTDLNNIANGFIVERIMQSIAGRHPDALPVLQQALSSLKTGVLLNKVTDNADALRVVKRFQDVAAKHLCLQVADLGTLACMDDIRSSTRHLVPVTVSDPRGPFTRSLVRVIKAVQALNGSDARTVNPPALAAV
jgi:flagellar biosynthesis protein FlhG